MEDLVIYGAGGLGRELLSLLKRDFSNKWNVIGFVDDAIEEGVLINFTPVLNKSYLFEGNKKMSVVLAIASPQIKEKIFNELKEFNPNLSFPTIVSKSAMIDVNAIINEGVVVTDFCWISTSVKLGKCVYLNVGNVIGHDAELGDFVSVMPSSNISGFVKIGERTMIGCKSFILQCKSVGKDATLAAGSVVFSNVYDGETVWGNPAHLLKR